jgi:hypothetical protein
LSATFGRFASGRWQWSNSAMADSSGASRAARKPVMSDRGSSSPLNPHTATPSELQERVAADRAGIPYLLWRDASGGQRIVALPASQERLTIGRTAEVDVPLPSDTQVSRVHALLERVARGWSIVDDGLSLNGTLVNGEPLRGRRRLDDRDRIQVGSTVLAFRDPAQGRAASTIRASARSAPLISEAQRRVLVALCRPFADGRPYPAAPTNEEIAAELVLSVETVKTHLKALVQHFALEQAPRAVKRVRLVERALESGAITAADFDRA